MEIDTDRIDEAVLAVLLLGLHNNDRAWKGFDWQTLNRLHTRGAGLARSGPGCRGFGLWRRNRVG
ncbi:DUF6429 family protein [Rhodospirillum rubrum]|uniref:DUF6429 domain-containing protein n=1 Tax=Rhodospirillum rubrum (strain ATCC 11170 / ATH 1.1.1 / DSM 467 / LMG 4362 / NCIMB 8255 / S1) TaxID=269796 RepID=Q2RXZ1_RHORT|nr:hypothetical protein [Rhodospirillum rubrum]ABC21004.1 hypothetical protein Rru_A0199 [Rhodospirillum rubrum ATCC 11170]MBK5952549.1 hypothetical protein [Rhodospirillum rubrum]QXG80700.1 hypothetical protein KUL73_01060 [Rhodospirillum rubrum]HAP99316.1 hypothetical protein [Rhodospirillum rubrum]